jgi:hypothetical protein
MATSKTAIALTEDEDPGPDILTNPAASPVPVSGNQICLYSVGLCIHFYFNKNKNSVT